MMQDLRKKLFSTPEGNIFIFGLFLSLSLIIGLLICYIYDASFANKIIGIVVSHLIFGRVPSLSFGYAAELSHLIVISMNLIMEMILVSLIYPLFVLSFKGMLKVDTLDSFFTKVQNYKEQHKKSFQKYGTLGLFIFVFIPFWMTGPIVGAIIGFLIGLSHYKNILIVFVATAIAISLWGLFLQELTKYLMIQDSSILWILALLFVISYLIFRFLRKE